MRLRHLAPPRRSGAEQTLTQRATMAGLSRLQGKIERWHQTLKNRILLENYYLPGDLEAHSEKFVDHRLQYQMSRIN
jgi:hypothetical protein